MQIRELTALNKDELIEIIERERSDAEASTNAALPTGDMVIAGFEAVSLFQSTDAYKDMSGCQGAAESARVCWAAMVAEMPGCAAPRQDLSPSEAAILGAWAEASFAKYGDEAALYFVTTLLARSGQPAQPADTAPKDFKPAFPNGVLSSREYHELWIAPTADNADYSLGDRFSWHVGEFADRVAEAAIAKYAQSAASAKHSYAEKEGERNAAADGYFKARARLMDTTDNRRIFEAGFDRGYDAAASAAKPSVQPIIATVMIDDGGECQAYCLMAAFRTMREAELVLAFINSTPSALEQAQLEKIHD